jgi:predicted ATPase
MIEYLGIKNFKSWEIANMPFSNLTGFFGANSSGKTSILQLLLLLKQTVESSDRALTLDLGNEKSYVQLGTFRDIIHTHELNRELFFELTWKSPSTLRIKDTANGNSTLSGDILTLRSLISQHTRSGKIKMEEFAYDFDGFTFKMFKPNPEKHKFNIEVSKKRNSDNRHFELKKTQGRKWELPEPLKFYGFPDQVKAYHKNADFLSDFQLQLEDLFSRIYYLGPLREYPHRQYLWAGAQPADVGIRGAQVVDALLAARTNNIQISRGKGKRRLLVEEYVALWLKDLNLIHDFRVERLVAESNYYQVKVRKTRNSTEVLLTDVGFGVSQILPVITLCYYVPEGSVLIIEQPEIHLHPGVQAGLADVFIDAIQTKNIQIILESHSEYLLRRLQRRIAEEKFGKDQASLFFCQTTEDKSELVPLQIDMFGNIQNWPQGFFGDEMAELAATSEAVFNRIKNGQ